MLYYSYGHIRIGLFIIFLLLPTCSSPTESPAPSPQSGTSAPRSTNETVQKLIDQGYKFKKTGNNADALTSFENAGKVLEESNNHNSVDYASCLDDQASVLLRMGDAPKARSYYEQAKSILTKLNKAPHLIQSIDSRITLIEELEKAGVTCKEPDRPLADSSVPYFPNVEQMQIAIGTLTRAVATCKNSNTIEPISIRAIITGDGKLVRAYARDDFAGTAVESCVVNRLKELIPQTSLPKFSACFRGFTYPFMIGNHPDPPKTEKETAPPSTQIPEENQTKTSPPEVTGALKGAQHLLEALKAGDPTVATDFFFPASAFDLVKDIPVPARYYKKLMAWYREDIQTESRRFKNGDWHFETIELGRCKWKEPGTEGNKIAYWSCRGNYVTVKDGTVTRRFEIRVLINWGPKWYVTHLGPIRK